MPLVEGLLYRVTGSNLTHLGRPATPRGTGTITTDPFTLGTTEPTAANTGVGVAGRTPKANLTLHAGNYTVTKDGEILKDLHVTGQLIVGTHVGTRVSNCWIEAQGNAYTKETRVIECGNGSDTYVEFSEISYNGSNAAVSSIGTKNFHLYRCDIHHGTDLIRVNRSGTGPEPGVGFFANIEGCYLHDLIVRTPDPLQSRVDNKTHSDPIQVESTTPGSTTRVFGNAIWGFHSDAASSNVFYAYRDATLNAYVPTTASDPNAVPYPTALSCVMITPISGQVVNDLRVENNWLRGGEISVNGPEKATGYLRNNRFGTDQIVSSPNNRYYKRSYTGGMVVSGNVLIADGSPA